MPFLTELDVYNQMLATMGETPLNAVDLSHPMIPSAITALRIASSREQAKSWWFNKELATLVPDVSSAFIYTPDDAIRVDPTDETMNYVQRGRRLYQPYAAASVDKYKFTKAVQCWIVRNVPFEDLPASAATYIAAAAVLDFQKDFDADVTKYQQLKLAKTEALVILGSENIRNLNVNLLNSYSMQRAMGAIAPQRRIGYLQNR